MYHIGYQGGIVMDRKPFTTSIDTNISGNFKAACEKRGVKMNVVLEAFMTQFANNEYAVVITQEGIKLKNIEEN